MNIGQLRESIRKYFVPYYEKNDRAHLINHADTVCDNALEYNQKLNLKANKKVLILAAYAHDIFATINRENHHKLASEFLLNENLPFDKHFSKKEIKMAANAVLRHRGSNKEPFQSIEEDIISCADRGKPNLIIVTIRSYQYAIDVLKQDHSKATKHALGHIKNKYSEDTGYVKYSTLYKKIFNQELNDFYRKVDSLTYKVVEQIINNY